MQVFDSERLGGAIRNPTIALVLGQVSPFYLKTKSMAPHAFATLERQRQLQQTVRMYNQRFLVE
jgi:hypothetical protein